MKVFINEREYDYTSDYPVDWKFVSKDYFKFPVYFGNVPCFIKRFQLRPQNALVWPLLEKLRFKNERNIPKVHDVVSVVENRAAIKYVFYEYIEGSTLDKVLMHETAIDLEKLTIDLLNAVASVHKYDYWFTDLCEKNIFRDTKRKYRLIDVDSCLPLSEAPSNDLDVNMFYYAVVYKFYRDNLRLTIQPADLSGNSLNYLQIIFLILNLKMSQTNPTHTYASDEAFNRLPDTLANLAPAFGQFFQKILTDENHGQSLKYTEETRLLIQQYILSPIPERMEEIPADRAAEVETPPVEKHRDARQRRERPVITSFTASTRRTGKTAFVQLSWDVRDAAKYKLFRNGKLYSEQLSNKGNLSIEESYDGVTRQLVYSLIVSNEAGNTASEPLLVNIDEILTFEEDANNPDLNGQSGKRKRAMLIAGIIVPVLIIALWFIFRPAEAKKPAIISNVAPTRVTKNYTIVISGENFPKDAANLQVLFNKHPGSLLFNSEHLISATVPDLPVRNKSGVIKLDLVINGDTIHSSKDLVWKQ